MFEKALVHAFLVLNKLHYKSRTFLTFYFVFRTDTPTIVGSALSVLNLDDPEMSSTEGNGPEGSRQQDMMMHQMAAGNVPNILPVSD